MPISAADRCAVICCVFFSQLASSFLQQPGYQEGLTDQRVSLIWPFSMEASVTRQPLASLCLI